MKANVYSDFLNNLYEENPRAAYALESMKYRLMSQTELDEASALEVVSKIAVKSGTNQPKQGAKEMLYNPTPDVPVSIPEDVIAEVVKQVTARQTQAAQREAADLGAVESELETVSAQLQPLYKNPSANRARIARLEARSRELWEQHEAGQAQVKAANVAQVQAQRQQIEAQLQPLQDEYNVKSKEPTKYRARLHELTALMRPLWMQLDGLK